MMYMLILFFVFWFFFSIIKLWNIKKIIVITTMIIFSFLFVIILKEYFTNSVKFHKIIIYGTMEEMLKISIPILFYLYYKLKKIKIEMIEIFKIYILSAFSFASIENYLYFYNFNLIDWLNYLNYLNRLIFPTAFHLLIPLILYLFYKWNKIKWVINYFPLFIWISFFHWLYNIFIEKSKDNYLIYKIWMVIIFLISIKLLIQNWHSLIWDKNYSVIKYIISTFAYGLLFFLLLNIITIKLTKLIL